MNEKWCIFACIFVIALILIILLCPEMKCNQKNRRNMKEKEYSFPLKNQINDELKNQINEKFKNQINEKFESDLQKLHESQSIVTEDNIRLKNGYKNNDIIQDPNTFIPKAANPLSQTPDHPHFNMDPSNCPVRPTELQMDDYLKNVIFKYSSGQTCAIPSSVSTIETGRDKYLNFNKYINKPSNDFEDAVDKVQQLYYTSNYDVSRANANCARIKDLYDGTTEIPKSICDAKNKISDNVNDVFPKISRSGNFGKEYTNDFWEYEHEKVNNGGKFYNNVMGYDEAASDEMLY